MKRHPKPTRRPLCRYCLQPVDYVPRTPGGSYKPLNDDGSPHLCRLLAEATNQREAER